MPDRNVIKSRVYRTLRPLRNFYAGGDHDILIAPPGLALVPGDEILGVYVNVPGKRDHAIVVSVHGMYVDQSSTWTFVAYEDIAEVAAPDPEKRQARHIRLTLAQGRTLLLLVTGGDEKFRDVFEVVRFLDRVMAHTRQSTDRSMPDS